MGTASNDAANCRPDRGLGRDAITAGQMSYDLRRLRAHGLITREPAQPPLPAHRYRTAPRHAAQPRPHPATDARPGSTRRPRPARGHRAALIRHELKGGALRRQRQHLVDRSFVSA